MRKTLFAAVALAPLWLLAAQAPAMADTTISSSTSNTAVTSADGDISVNSGGTISPTTSGGEAIRVDSQNNVTNSGELSYKDLNSVTGILIQGVPTPTSSVIIQNAGTISVVESYAAKDTNGDGVNEAPFASTTSSERYGIHLANGSVPFQGLIENTGTISIQGDNSYGIFIESPLIGTAAGGALTNSGTITYVGDGGAAILTTQTGTITGPVSITGTISTLGSANSQTSPLLGANGLVLGGAVDGRVSIYGTITSTGYGLTTRPTSPTTLQTIQQTSTEVMQGGSAVVIMGGASGGVFLGAPPSTTNTSDVTTDADGDGGVDSSAATSAITTSGAAPALVIGAASGTTATYGLFAGTTAPNNTSSIIIEGTVTGAGVYDKVPATAVQIGGLIDGPNIGTTVLDGGIRVTGTLSATAFAANATGLHIGAGVMGASGSLLLENDGSITAAVSPPSSTSDTSIPAYGSISSPTTATAILIDPGSSLTSLVNTGAISATLTGDINDIVSAAAVLDKSGTLSSVTNTGIISASFVADATAAVVNSTRITLADGSTSVDGAVALDLSANKTGTTLLQQQAPNTVITTVTTNSVPVATVSAGATDTGNVATAAVATSVTTGDTVVSTTVPSEPEIIGDVYLGSGTNTVSLLGGVITGALDLGTGANSVFDIENGAVLSGPFYYGGTGLTLTVNGTLDYLSPLAARQGSTNIFQASSVNVGSTGQIFFGVDPASNRAAELLVSGAATFASGAKIGLTFLSNATSQQTYTLVSASTLNLGSNVDTSLLGAVPYIFNASIGTNVAAGQITATISPKTASQLGLSSNQAPALPAVYDALTHDPAVQSVFLNQYTKAGFTAAYNQILPDYSGGTFQAANAASLAIGRATAESNDIENPTGSRGAWVQEVLVGVNQGAGQTDGYRGGGFGFVGGVETGGSGLGAFGLTSAFVATSVSDPHLQGDSATSMSELEVGGYWQGEFSGLVADARVGVGYLWMAGRREFIETDSTGDITLDRKVKSNWNGYTVSGRFGLSYRWDVGPRFLGGGWFVEPQTHLDYFRLDENAYNDNEAQGGPGFSLDYQSRTGQETSGTASVILGRKLGTGLIWRPSVEFGVRDVFTGDAGDTTARFNYGTTNGQYFTLSPADIQGVAGIVRAKLKVSSEYYELGAEAGAEALSSRYEEADFKLSARVLF